MPSAGSNSQQPLLTSPGLEKRLLPEGSGSFKHKAPTGFLVRNGTFHSRGSGQWKRNRLFSEQKFHWCEQAARLPAAGASVNTHISNNLELSRLEGQPPVESTRPLRPEVEHRLAAQENYGKVFYDDYLHTVHSS